MQHWKISLAWVIPIHEKTFWQKWDIRLVVFSMVGVASIAFKAVSLPWHMFRDVMGLCLFSLLFPHICFIMCLKSYLAFNLSFVFPLYSNLPFICKNMKIFSICLSFLDFSGFSTLLQLNNGVCGVFDSLSNALYCWSKFIWAHLLWEWVPPHRKCDPDEFQPVIWSVFEIECIASTFVMT